MSVCSYIRELHTYIPYPTDDPTGGGGGIRCTLAWGPPHPSAETLPGGNIGLSVGFSSLIFWRYDISRTLSHSYYTYMCHRAGKGLSNHQQTTKYDNGRRAPPSGKYFVSSNTCIRMACAVNTNAMLCNATSKRLRRARESRTRHDTPKGHLPATSDYTTYHDDEVLGMTRAIFRVSLSSSGHWLQES